MPDSLQSTCDNDGDNPGRLARSFGSVLPPTGFLRLEQIIGSNKTDPPTPALIPIRKSAWWEGVRTGKYPKPLKLGARTTVWRVEDIHALIERLGAQQAA